jgi:hypothetical protein
VVSVTDPYGRILGFLDRSKLFCAEEQSKDEKGKIPDRLFRIRVPHQRSLGILREIVVGGEYRQIKFSHSRLCVLIILILINKANPCL